METGIESVDTIKWLEYVLSNCLITDSPVSSISQSVNVNPYNPYPFKFIYHEADVLSLLDSWYVNTIGARAIKNRLDILVNRLPKIIHEERRRLNICPNEKYIIYNLGSAYSLDTIYAVVNNPELKDLVRIFCVDPDKESLDYGKALAEKLGVSDCFEFIPKKMQDAELGQAHLIMFIGMFCVVPSKKIALIMSSIKKYVKKDGIVIFSTVQEKMLMDGPILDFTMWSCGWRMYFKTDDEPGRLAWQAGYIHERLMDFEDDFGHNRITVARRPRFSIARAIGDAVKLIKIFLM
jgi:SAM-dependent methyltransferase